jgi:hypothetical protein
MIEVRAFRSDGMIEAIYEREGWADDHDPGVDLTAEVLIGTYEWVQLTYRGFRVSEPEGEHIGVIDGPTEDWYFEGHKYPFSDVVIGPPKDGV